MYYTGHQGSPTLGQHNNMLIGTRSSDSLHVLQLGRLLVTTIGQHLIGTLYVRQHSADNSTVMLRSTVSGILVN